MARVPSWVVVGVPLVALAGAVVAVAKTDWVAHPPQPAVTTHVVFEATPNPPLAAEPPCYRMPGVNIAAGSAARGDSWDWEMLGSATQSELAAVRVCLSRDRRLGPISARIVTGRPGFR